MLRKTLLPLCCVLLSTAVASSSVAVAANTKTKHAHKKTHKKKTKKHKKTRVASGPRGPQGANGTNGRDGTPGTNGINGASGTAGSNGTAGTNGTTGTPGADSDQPRVVNEANMRGFTLAPKGDNGDTSANGIAAFDTPPTAPPLGTRALHLTSTAGKPVAAYAFNRFADPSPTEYKLAELTHASYASLVHAAGSTAQDVALQMEVVGSTSSGSGYTTVVFEPYQQGDVQALDVWHRHSFDRGKVWSTRALAAGDCTQAVPCPFQTFVNENPQARVETVKFRVGQNSGPATAVQDSYVDDFSFGFGPVVRYDFGG